MITNKKYVIHIHNEYPEHDWFKDEDGKIDMWALDSGFHNGPMCKRCGESFCLHCNPNWEQDSPCVEDYYMCPNCGTEVSRCNFCPECGQALNWEVE